MPSPPGPPSSAPKLRNATREADRRCTVCTRIWSGTQHGSFDRALGVTSRSAAAPGDAAQKTPQISRAAPQRGRAGWGRGIEGLKEGAARTFFTLRARPGASGVDIVRELSKWGRELGHTLSWPACCIHARESAMTGRCKGTMLPTVHKKAYAKVRRRVYATSALRWIELPSDNARRAPARRREA